MRKIAGVVGVVGVFGIIIFSVRGNDGDAKMREVIARAIKAHGGEENLAKFKASVTKMTGKIIDLDYRTENSIQLPDRMRNEGESKVGKLVQVLRGDKGWVKLGDLSRECVKEELDEMHEQLNAWQISRLTVLNGKDYKLSPVEGEIIDDRPTIGVRVEHPGFRDVTLFFDKENYLLLKIRTRIKDVLRGGEEIAAETLYSDYKNVDGVMTAHKFTIKYDGRVFNEGVITEVKYVERLDDSLFERP